MIKVKFNKSYDVATRWSELESDQFIPLASAIERFELGAIGFDEFRIAVVAAILRIDMRKTRLTDTLAENFFRISEKLTFPYSISDDRDRKVINFRIILDRQMVPEMGKYSGYSFECKYGMADTSLVAEQYVDAVSLMQLYSRGHDEQVLDRLVSVLYSGEPYGTRHISLVRSSVLPHNLKIAAYYNFRGILEWIRRLPKYDLIYNKTEDRSSMSFPMGLEGSIYTLAKAGYGDYRQICGMNLFTYLDLLLDQSIESLRTLKGCGLKPVEIAEKMNLSVEQIAELI